MTSASGLGTQWGFARETTYGTPVTPTKFYDIDSVGMALDQNYQDGFGLRKDRIFQPSGRMLQTTRQAGGDTPMQVPTKLFGSVLDLMNGVVNTPVQQAATIAYLNTFNIGTSQPNKFVTQQTNKPDLGGTDHPTTYTGSVLTGASFTAAQDGVLTCVLSWDGQDERTPTTTPAGATLATASYASGTTSWIGAGSGVTINVNGSPYGFAKSWSLNWQQPYYTDRWYLGSGGLKKQPIPNGYPTVTGTIEGDFDSETLYTLYRSGAIVDIYADFQGNTIASTYKEQIKFDCTAAQIRGASPTVPGPDILSQSVTYTAGDNGSTVPLIVSYMSTDTAV